MRRVLIAGSCVIAAALVSLGAQTPARDGMAPVPPPTGAAVIAGVVKDHEGAPVRRATVSIAGDMRLDRQTVAGDDGRFAFSGLPAGRFTVTAQKAGYPARSYGASRPFRTGSGVMLQDGQQVRDLELTLAKGGVITGTVFDQRGEPMPGVPIMAWQVRTSLGGARTLDHTGDEPVTVITDERGLYRIYNLPPGEFTIGTSWYYQGGDDVRVPTDAEIRAAFQPASQAGRGGLSTPTPTPSPAPPRFSFAPTFAPGVVDPMTAMTVTLAPGDVREGVDLRMQFVPMSEIVGTIVSADGGSFEVDLQIARRSPIEALNTISVSPGMTARTFSSGSLSPGPYTVMATADATPGRPALWARADVMVSGGQPASVALVLQPAMTLTGKVVFEGSSLTPPKDLSSLAVFFRAVAPDEASTATKIDAAGGMTITGVIPGRYRVSGSVPSGPAIGPWWSVKSVVFDGRDVTDLPFEIGGGNAATVTVTFTDVTAELSGALTTPAGTPATDYFLILMPADRTYWGSRSRRLTSVRPDRAGQYVFPRLPAGEYLVAVTTDLVPQDLQDVSALERLAADAVKVTLTFGARKTLDLRTR
jgi:protocatechuate 3,4-dioxygenase beta subunit